MVAGFAMTKGHGRGKYPVTVIMQILPGEDGDFLPAVPVNFASPGENGVEPGLVEWDFFSCMCKELRKLAALIFKDLPSRPVLAFHQ